MIILKRKLKVKSLRRDQRSIQALIDLRLCLTIILNYILISKNQLRKALKLSDLFKA